MADKIMGASTITNGIQEIELSSWGEFHEHVTGEFLSRPAFIYRGQAKYEWALESSLDRHERVSGKRQNLAGGTPKEFNCTPLTREQQINAFRQAIRGRRGPHAPELSDDQCWALGQHYGLKTPLLDWTLSPFAALFFAFEQPTIPEDIHGRVCFMEPRFRGVYAFSTSALEGRLKGPRVELVSPQTEENVRLFGQAGVFLKMPQGENLEQWVRHEYPAFSADAYLIKISIPNAGRDECLKTLNKMNINNMTVFPDLVGAAKHVNSLWQPGYEDLIAWLGRTSEEGNAD